MARSSWPGDKTFLVLHGGMAWVCIALSSLLCVGSMVEGTVSASSQIGTTILLNNTLTSADVSSEEFPQGGKLFLLSAEAHGSSQHLGTNSRVNTAVLPKPASVNVAVAQSGALHSEGSVKVKLTPKSWFAITFSFAFVIKALCMLSNVVFQVSPLPLVRKFSREQDTGEADAAPFISILYGGCQWCFYGFFAFLVTRKSGFLVLVYSNIMGAFLGIYYIWGFQANCQNKHSLSRLIVYYRGVCIIVGVQVVAIMWLSRQQALYFCGLVSSVCSVLGSCSLLSTLPVVLRDRSSASINLPLLIAGLSGALLWIVCGFILWDFLIVVPNMISLFVQGIALSFVVYFPRDGSRATSATGNGNGADRFLPHAANGSSTTSSGDYGTLQICGETGGTF